MATLCWSITEITRFSFYSLKTLDVDISTNMLGSIIGHMRYNSFIILYPVGVTGELLCFYSCWLYCIKRREAAMSVPLTLKLPNAYNFAFDYENFLKFAVPIIYIAGFPGLYMHMWGQRKKHYIAMDEAWRKAQLAVDEIYRTCPGIGDLLKIPVVNGKLSAAAAEAASLQHKEGTVMLVDFWATWCPPC